MGSRPSARSARSRARRRHASPGPSPSGNALVGNMQDSPAMLAVNGDDVVHQQTAVGAIETDLVGTEHRLQQPQEQPDTDEHDDDGEHPAARTLERDVAEA